MEVNNEGASIGNQLNTEKEWLASVNGLATAFNSAIIPTP